MQREGAMIRTAEGGGYDTNYWREGAMIRTIEGEGYDTNYRGRGYDKSCRWMGL